uniref:GPI mannosyltransferase 2 n=1 Tax=Elaeophora elaphi TaxID=1147741 RepID=A0A0R3S406_9BILA
MEIIRNGCCATKSFISAVIEWRSAAAAPYFMWSVFYLDKETQLRLLFSLAVGIFGWDILLSSTYNRSILFHILTWPVRNVLRTTSVLMALYSAQFLYRTEFEKACWAAYSAGFLFLVHYPQNTGYFLLLNKTKTTMSSLLFLFYFLCYQYFIVSKGYCFSVALLMINPVWLHYEVPQKINECLYTVCITTRYVTQITIISPLYSFYRIIEYIVRLRWLIAILEKVENELLRIKTAVISTYVATVAKLCAGKNAVLDVTNSVIFNIQNFISRTVNGFKSEFVNSSLSSQVTFCEYLFATKILFIRWLLEKIVIYFIVAVKNGMVYAVTTTRNGIVYVIKGTKNGIVFVIMSLKDGILFGFLALKNGLIGGILLLKSYLILGLTRSKDAFYYAVITIKNYIRYALVTIKNSILKFCSVVVEWVEMRIIKPIRSAFRAFIQFLQYWLCAHWWPDLRSWFVLHVIRRLQLLFNYFCFGIVYIFCGYWANPFIAFLSRHFRRFYAYFQQTVLYPVKIWIGRQIDKALIYIKRLLHNLAIGVRDIYSRHSFHIFWQLFQICAHLYRILLQPIVDVLYKKYKICEDYLLIYCLGPVCQVFVDHIPDRSPFCDDTDTELADLLPPGFSNEESDIEEASDKPSLPSRSLSPLTDSSEAEFALRPKSKSQKLLRKKPKAHPKDPAPSLCNDELISTAHKVEKDKCKRSSSTSSHSESVVSSSAQNASDDADLQNLDALDFESEDRSRTELLGDTVEIQKLEDSGDGGSKDRKQNMNQKKVQEVEVCGTGQISVNSAAFTSSLDGSFEALENSINLPLIASIQELKLRRHFINQ